MHLLRSKHQVTHIDAYFKIGWEILYSMAYKSYVACLQNGVPLPICLWHSLVTLCPPESLQAVFGR